MIKKLKIIILSRFKNNNEEEWVKKRRVTCLECKYNSLNASNKTLVHYFLAALSKFYSTLTFRKKDDTLGNCLACESCSIFFKSAEEDETCPKNKWKE